MLKDPGYFNCNACPLNAICLGGDTITPLPSFWRASNKSTLILTCPVKEACLGAFPEINKNDLEVLIKGECFAGHHGALCYECNKDLVRLSPKSLCNPCDSQPLIYKNDNKCSVSDRLCSFSSQYFFSIGKK